MNRATIKQIGKDNVRKQWGELLLALVLVEAAGTVAALLTLGIGSLIVTGPLDFGVTYLYYMQTQGEQPGQKMLLEGFKKKFGDSFLAGLLLGLIGAIPAVIGIITGLVSLVRTINRLRYGFYYGGYYDSYGGYGGGFSFGTLLLSLLEIALLVVCVYVLYAICMSIYILVREQDKTAVGAIKKSWAMTKGQKGRLFVFDLSFIGWGILCCLTFGILLIWVAPYYRSAKTVLFNDIYDNSHVSDNPDFSFRNEFNDLKGMVSKPGEQTTAPVQPEQPVQPQQPEPQQVQPEQPQQPQQPQVPRVKYCKHCGAELPVDLAFCTKCGAPQ